MVNVYNVHIKASEVPRSVVYPN